MRLINAEPIEQKLFRQADKALAKNPYENARICAFRRAFELILSAPTIAPPPNDTPPNDPLTLEELREMSGEPVWVERHDGGPSRWAIVGNFESMYGIYFGTAQGGLRLPYDFSGKTWLAYRRKPEEGT